MPVFEKLSYERYIRITYTAAQWVKIGTDYLRMGGIGFYLEMGSTKHKSITML